MKAFALGLRKPKEFMEERSKASQFDKGHRPFNKGRNQDEWMSEEGKRNSAKTQFKPGTVHPNSPTLKAAGYESIRSYKGQQYIWIKPHDGRRMMPKHRYIWEQAYGAIPKGMNVQFRDGNPLNCVLDNLYLISRASQVRKNWDDLPDERKAETIARIHDKRNQSIRADQIRLKWGLEPRGRLVKRPKR